MCFHPQPSRHLSKAFQIVLTSVLEYTRIRSPNQSSNMIHVVCTVKFEMQTSLNCGVFAWLPEDCSLLAVSYLPLCKYLPSVNARVYTVESFIIASLRGRETLTLSA